ncbi:hepatic lectin-like isoform X1 [Bufo bufo]|uniref:hepatic lectin-like isoform X1 n=1 Tax=Bufo bufo TaxID=8384 RepID=UPI001ABE1666|nr:hepatic lectin-like isoform X1 [Bufo bufo]XP_040270824.1 hepatic lectin-like isoform X1 [Bufo bufo]
MHIVSISSRSMDSEYSAKQEGLMDKQRSGDMRSYFKERPVIITYGLLALSFILVIVLFATVHSQNFTPERKELASKDDILGLNITVSSLTEKMKEIERAAKKRSMCDTGWQQFDSKCYFFSRSKSNWYRSRTMCVMKNADLVVINNENEQRFIKNIVKSTPSWIGLTDSEEEGNWTWVDGTDYKTSYKDDLNGVNISHLEPMIGCVAVCHVIYGSVRDQGSTGIGLAGTWSWRPNEPNNTGDDEDCGYTATDADWNDKGCHVDTFYAICEKKL